MEETSYYKGKCELTPDNKIKIRKTTPSNLVIRATLVFLFVASIYGLIDLEKGDKNFIQAFQELITNLQVMFFQLRYSHFTLSYAIYQVGVTLGLAFITTLLGAGMAMILGLFAAQNLTNKAISGTIKGIVAFIRAVPTVLWVLVFAIAAGLGAVAAVIGMTFHSMGYLIKAYSESFEEVDEGTIEALKASGANWWQIVFQAVLPASMTYILSWTFIRFEINFTNAVAMGAAAGAGGIGFELFMSSAFYYDIKEVGFITLLIVIVAILLEMFSTKAKKRFLLDQN